MIVSALLSAPGVALADGDPASDVLVSRTAFVPWDISASTAAQARLAAELTAAARAGYPVRVALIASSSDLGSVTELWRQPANYAHFLWQELSFAVHGPVLVVMPNGLGLYTGQKLTAAQTAALGRFSTDAAGGVGGGLLAAAVTAVSDLAGAAGHQLPEAIAGANAPRAAGSGGAGAVVSWIVFVIGAAAIAAAWGFSLRARPLRIRSRGERA